MKKLIYLMALLPALLFSCGSSVRPAVDAEGDGSFDFNAGGIADISGEVHGIVDSLATTVKAGKGTFLKINRLLRGILMKHTLQNRQREALQGFSGRISTMFPLHMFLLPQRRNRIKMFFLQR